MSNALLSSKIVTNEAPPRVSTSTSQPTAVLGMVGIAERGPIGQAVRVTSYDQWVDTFGGFTTDTKDTVAAVEGFFAEGGQFLSFVRTCRYTDVNDPNSAEAIAASAEIDTPASTAAAATILGNLTETFSLADGDTLIISLDGAAGVTATFNAGPATDLDATGENYALTDGNTLTISVDGEADQTVTFNTADFATIGAATAAEVAAVINAQTTDILAEDDSGAVRVTNTRGSGTGYSIEVTGGTDIAAFSFPGSPANGTGDAADAAAVTVAELKTLIEADISGTTVTAVGGAVQIAGTTTGSAATLQVLAASTLDTKLGLSNLEVTGTDAATATATLSIPAKYAGTYGDDVVVRIAAASSGEAARFNLLVLEDGFVREQFPNLTMDDTATQGYVEDVINLAPSRGGSRLIQALDLDAGLGSALLDRPANGDYSLSGGDDGLTNIGDVDFIGSSLANNGLRALDTQDDLTLLAVPARATAAVHNAMLTYCEVTRTGTMFAVCDCPQGLTAEEMKEYVESTALLLESSEYGCIYFPRAQVLNPSTEIFGPDENITVPPSGIACGRYARTDASQPGGIYKPPAGVVRGKLTSIVGLEILPGREVPETFDVNKRDLLYPARINMLREGDSGRWLDGVRTFKSTGNFPTIAERRGVIFIEGRVEFLLEPLRFDNNDVALRAKADRITRAFLTSQMDVGAFRSRDADLAFQTDFGRGLNPDSVIFAGQLRGRYGLATQKPGEFIILTVSQDTRALEQEISQP